MIRKISLIGLFIGALLICGCAKEEPEASSAPSTAPSVDNVDNESKPVVNEDVSVGNKKVKLQTTMGDIVIEMQSQAAPDTVKNFIQYVESGFYDGIIFHRVIKGFMIQTGGFNAQMQQKQPNPPIKNEFKISNTRGTVAMAKLGGNPDSATCQFFISVADNSRNLDNQNGGFTVFGKVVEGMDVVDEIAAVQTTVRNGMRDVPAEMITITSASVVSQ
ncbi:MAG: peptidylprolyl isomerase [Sedimentisphaerales bacterium]|nr:peptidylprolyl isomerase [Sedimentisphaerales bacterium]